MKIYYLIRVRAMKQTKNKSPSNFSPLIASISSQYKQSISLDSLRQLPHLNESSVFILAIVFLYIFSATLLLAT